ncbi:hypothetical protein OG948_11645 [Embleya sp. NBC_00888]|uniref:hypothetical protein n=1 Tax=Embleya sp. NBC_00888 TaxID=2975960 RepID=UPI00386A4C6B|nr:hypothetical protein OG948_11645 [Embleya sp. NBC_00888]
MRDAGPTRRAVLGTVAAATIAAAVVGCDDNGGGADQGRRRIDDAARERAYATTGALLAHYDAVAARDAALAERIRPLSLELREHLRVFAGGASHSAPPPAAAPQDAAAAGSAVADRAQQASDERLTGLDAVSPELARKLAATAACLAGHAQLLRSAS